MNTMTYQQLIPKVQTKGFALLGDTQRTMFYQVLMGREKNNHLERKALIGSLADLIPDFLIINGDLVSYGQSLQDWTYFDEIMAPLRSKNIPILPVMGNHDYFFSKKRAMSHITTRFPSLIERTWGSFIYENLGFIYLDSNSRMLGKVAWKEQINWFQNEIKKFDQDPKIKGILVFGHHPPYTNSFEVFPHGPTRKYILPSFFESKKTLGYFSGHCHAYERFHVNGKFFIVSGGGGGPRQPLRLGKWQREEDQFMGQRVRPFHYIWIEVQESSLHLTVIGGEKGMTTPSIVEKVAYTFSTLEGF